MSSVRTPRRTPPPGSELLQRAASVRAFLDQPADRYLAGESWLVFHVRDHVAGLAMWGTPTMNDVRPLLEIFEAFDSPLGRPLPRYMDARRLVTAEQAVIAAILQFVGRNLAELPKIFTAIAFVHRGGLGQAITEGVRMLAGLQIEWRAFDAPPSALAWLGRGDAVELGAQLDALIDRAAGGSLVVHDVRVYCAANLATASLEGSARALRMSRRSLQRRLGEHGTSFQQLLNDVRVTQAKQLLVSTPRSIAEIASAVGCEPRYFTTLFRRLAGCTPLAWRERVT